MTPIHHDQDHDWLSSVTCIDAALAPLGGCRLYLTDDDSLMDGLLPVEVPHPAGLGDSNVFSRRNLGEKELSCWTSHEPCKQVVKPELPGPWRGSPAQSHLHSRSSKFPECHQQSAYSPTAENRQ